MSADFRFNAMYFLPFTTNRVSSLDELLLRSVNPGAAGAVCRFAIYDSRSDTDLFPKNKLFQSAYDFPVDGTTSTGCGSVAVSCATGCTVEDAGVSGGFSNIRLLPSQVYWIGLWCNAQFGPAYIPIAATWEFGGINDTLDTFSNG